MSATRTTYNKVRNYQNRIFWSAQYKLNITFDKAVLLELRFVDGEWTFRKGRGVSSGSAQAALRLYRQELLKAVLHQGKCPCCKKKFQVEELDDAVTVEHISGSYDHAKREEKSKHRGTIFMHSACHKAKTINEKINAKKK